MRPLPWPPPDDVHVAMCWSPHDEGLWTEQCAGSDGWPARDASLYTHWLPALPPPEHWPEPLKGDALVEGAEAITWACDKLAHHLETDEATPHEQLCRLRDTIRFAAAHGQQQAMDGLRFTRDDLLGFYRQATGDEDTTDEDRNSVIVDLVSDAIDAGDDETAAEILAANEWPDAAAAAREIRRLAEAGRVADAAGPDRIEPPLLDFDDYIEGLADRIGALEEKAVEGTGDSGLDGFLNRIDDLDTRVYVEAARLDTRADDIGSRLDSIESRLEYLINVGLRDGIRNYLGNAARSGELARLIEGSAPRPGSGLAASPPSTLRRAVAPRADKPAST